MEAKAKTDYTVGLPIEVAGRVYQYGETVELDDATAALYGHALRAKTPAAAEETPKPAITDKVEEITTSGRTNS